MAEDKERIVAIIESINRAWLEGRYSDIAGHVHEAIVLSPPGAAPLTGRDAIVKSYADFGSAATVHAFELEELRVHCWGSTAVAECPFVIDYEIPSGRFKERGVDLLVFTRTDAAWQVCWRTMTSAPDEKPS